MNIIDVKTSSGEYPIILGCNIISELKKYTIDIDILLENSTVEIAKECINSIKKYWRYIF